MKHQNVTDAFDILIRKLETALKETRQAVALASQQGTYDEAQARRSRKKGENTWPNIKVDVGEEQAGGGENAMNCRARRASHAPAFSGVGPCAPGARDPRYGI